MNDSMLNIINLDESILRSFAESAMQQGPYCGILSRRPAPHLYPVHHPDREHVLCTGSMVDGTGHAAGGLWQIDTDYMHEIHQLEDESRIRYCDKPGYVWVEMGKDEMDKLVRLKGKTYLSAKDTRNVTGEKKVDIEDTFGLHLKVTPPGKTGASTPFLMNLGRNTTQEEYLNSLISPPPKDAIKISKPAILEPKEEFTHHFDYVKAVHCKFWPEIAHSWRVRARKIYSSEEVEKLVSYGVHLVPKSTPDGNADLDFRISFTVTEDNIIKAWSDTQWLCYLILKCLLKLRLTELGKVVTTYHFKTLMMWACEEKDKSLWREDNIIHCILGVIDDLLLAMNEKILRHYFIPSANLFDNITEDSMKEAMQPLEKLRSEIETASKQMPGQHWLCVTFKSNCYHPKDQISFDDGEKLAFNSLKFSNDMITLQIKEAVLKTLNFYEKKTITEKEYEKRELLMNVCLRMLEDKMDFASQVTTLTNYELSVPPPSTNNLDPFLLTNTAETNNQDYLMDLAKPQIALQEIINKHFTTTENSPDDPWVFITQIVPESISSFTQTKLLKYKWKELKEIKEMKTIFPFPESLESLTEEEGKAWNFICEAAKVSRMNMGVDKEPSDTDKLSAAVIMEHIFWESLGTEKSKEVLKLENIPNIGGIDFQAVLKPLENIIQSKQCGPPKSGIQEEELD